MLKTKTQPTGFGSVWFWYDSVLVRFNYFILKIQIYIFSGFFKTFLMGLVSV